MPLSPDAKLGPYEILSAIGAGGRGEVYKARVPKLKWSPDGQELYLLAAHGNLMAAGLKLGPDSVTPSPPRELFTVPGASRFQPYAVAPDGKRFLILAPVGDSQPLEVIAIWPGLLKKGEPNE